MRLEASVLRTHLRRQNFTVYALTRLMAPEQREGIEALLLFIEILRHSVDAAGTRDEALRSVGDLEILFGQGETHTALVDQPKFYGIVDSNPNFGLAWEAWCSLEEAFGLPRATALDFIEGLRFDSENRRIESLEALLNYAFLTGGIFGGAISRILDLDASFTQAAVDGASSARLTSLTRNYRHDIELGRSRMPVEVISNSADVLFRSFKDSLPKVSLKYRLVFTIALILHREKASAMLSTIDRTADALILVCARRISEVFRRSKNQANGPLAASPLAASIDRSLALKNQSLRLKSKPTNDHTPDTPNTSR